MSPRSLPNLDLDTELGRMTAALTPGAYLPEGGVVWSSSEGQVTNLGATVLCLLGFWLVLPVFYAVYLTLRTACHRYTLTDQRLRERRGILSVTTEELELYRVKDITVKQPLLQRLVGRGSVVLTTSDRTTPVVVLNAIGCPDVVADLVRACVERSRVAKGVREIDA
jgi:uncharacterized membrane protein YdbT with pleckstrin-like domain